MPQSGHSLGLVLRSLDDPKRTCLQSCSHEKKGGAMKLQDWANWAEILASIAVVASLVFLAMQVRDNTRALESQAISDRAATLNGPFTNGSAVPEIFAKIKAVDGPEPLEQAYVDRYGMTYEEAGIWKRYMGTVWGGLAAIYARSGESSELTESIQLLALFPDDQMYWNLGGMGINEGFRAYVHRALALPEADRVHEYRQRLQELKEQQSRSN